MSAPMERIAQEKIFHQTVKMIQLNSVEMTVYLFFFYHVVFGLSTKDYTNGVDGLNIFI